MAVETATAKSNKSIFEVVMEDHDIWGCSEPSTELN